LTGTSTYSFQKAKVTVIGPVDMVDGSDGDDNNTIGECDFNTTIGLSSIKK
jgi:hypothetical protein